MQAMFTTLALVEARITLSEILQPQLAPSCPLNLNPAVAKRPDLGAFPPSNLTSELKRHEKHEGHKVNAIFPGHIVTNLNLNI